MKGQPIEFKVNSRYCLNNPIEILTTGKGTGEDKGVPWHD